MTLSEVRQKILEEIPPEWRFRAEDGEVIQKHKDLLLSFTEELVQGFYDTLFAHPATRAVFQEGERPKREETLRAFWQRVAQGPHDGAFWDWMTWVGVVHIKRKVTNPMMISAWGYILNKAKEKVKAALPPEEAFPLLEALTRLSKTAEALTAEGYLETTLAALQRGSGISPNLMDQLVRVELEELERQIKGG